jgi:hypothetical protein
MRECKKVVIFDDEDGPRQDWVERLRAVRGFAGEFETRVVNNDEFGSALNDLRKRRVAARAGEEILSESNFLDETDVLIIDYDLLALNETGEEVAYLARCFSDCGIIIGVNQFAREGFTFDLTLLGHPESFADLNLLLEQVFDPGLWSSTWSDFRPWYWPLLPKAISDFNQRSSELENNLDRSIFDLLEIPLGIREVFPINALEFISSEQATFRQFVEKSGKALRGKDRAASDHAIARIAAARLSKWLERLVLPGQNILVDAPHLLERYPSLYIAGTGDQLIARRSNQDLLTPRESLMDLKKIESFIFAKREWLSRDAWYWPQVSECEELPEVSDPWATRLKLAFCEDTSRFTLPEAAIEFLTRVDSPFMRRYVSTRDSNYGPRLQFAL